MQKKDGLETSRLYGEIMKFNVVESFDSVLEMDSGDTFWYIIGMQIYKRFWFD